MSKIDSIVADRIIRHLIDISNDKLFIDEDSILAEEDPGMQEILLGLKHLYEDLLYNKQKKQEATELITNKNKLLSEQNKELEHFAYVISHDLKAPLIGIHSLASFIEEDLDSNKKAVSNHLEILKDRVSKMESLIEGILEFSKIGMIKSKKQAINLNNLVVDVFKNLNSPDEFEFKLINKLPTILGVESLFIQLFSNLISNAIKFNDKKNGYIHIDYKDLGEDHEFSIKDNGPGISSDYHEKIFVVFQTLNSDESSNSYKNTGIGLSIVKKIVTNLNGSILLKSEQGNGSNFIVRIPKSQED